MVMLLFLIVFLEQNALVYLYYYMNWSGFLFMFLQTNDALVASLLRLKDNNIHIEEAERSLKKREKYSELIILYEKKGLHEKGGC